MCDTCFSISLHRTRHRSIPCKNIEWGVLLEWLPEADCDRNNWPPHTHTQQNETKFKGKWAPNEPYRVGLHEKIPPSWWFSSSRVGHWLVNSLIIIVDERSTILDFVADNVFVGNLRNTMNDICPRARSPKLDPFTYCRVNKKSFRVLHVWTLSSCESGADDGVHTPIYTDASLSDELI